MTTPSARALLAGLVDYAGLFPPAALSMDDAVAEYARGRRSPEAWMLGRFVLPASRLAELARAADAHLPEPGADGPLPMRLFLPLVSLVALGLLAACGPKGPAWVGLSMVVLGCVLVGLTIALGG